MIEGKYIYINGIRTARNAPTSFVLPIPSLQTVFSAQLWYDSMYMWISGGEPYDHSDNHRFYVETRYCPELYFFSGMNICYLHLFGPYGQTFESKTSSTVVNANEQPVISSVNYRGNFVDESYHCNGTQRMVLTPSTFQIYGLL